MYCVDELVMSGAVRMNPLTTKASNRDVEDETKEWMKFAKERHEGRKKRDLEKRNQNVKSKGRGKLRESRRHQSTAHTARTKSSCGENDQTSVAQGSTNHRSATRSSEQSSSSEMIDDDQSPCNRKVKRTMQNRHGRDKSFERASSCESSESTSV